MSEQNEANEVHQGRDPEPKDSVGRKPYEAPRVLSGEVFERVVLSSDPPESGALNC